MVSASFVYLSSFTISNLLFCLYLQRTVNEYRETGKMPRWAERTRAFFEKMEDTIKPLEVEQVDKFIKEDAIPQLENLLTAIATKDSRGNLQYPSTLTFLQLAPVTVNNTYDIRDDHEYRRSLAKSSNDPTERMLNDHRRSNSIPNDLDEFREKLAQDEPTHFKKQETEASDQQGNEEDQQEDDEESENEFIDDINDNDGYISEVRERLDEFVSDEKTLDLIQMHLDLTLEPDEMIRFKKFFELLIIQRNSRAASEQRSQVQEEGANNVDWLNEDETVLIKDRKELLRRYANSGNSTNLRRVINQMQRDSGGGGEEEFKSADTWRIKIKFIECCCLS